MRQRILVILGAAVALLVFYTFVVRARPAGVAGLQGATVRLQSSIPTQAAKSAKAPAAKPQPGTAAADSSKPVPKPSDMTAKPAAVAETTVVAPEEWAADPFVRDWIMINEVSNLVLKAITVGGDRAYVLINDQILEEGDQISGKRIVKIEADKVTLEQGGRTFTLLLGE